MPDIFISYASQDQKLAEIVKSGFESHGISVFLASVSIPPGEKWSEAIKSNLLSSKCIIFLASKKACSSPFVQQELGMALGASKKLIPIIWEINPEDLPGWINQNQALDLRGGTMDDLEKRIEVIANSMHMEKLGAILLFCAGILAAYILFNPDNLA